jgi:hypothetical protein
MHLIEEFDLRVPHEGIRSILAGLDEVKIKGDLVTFSSDLVSNAVSSQDYSDLPKELEPDNPGIVAGAYV